MLHYKQTENEDDVKNLASLFCGVRGSSFRVGLRWVIMNLIMEKKNPAVLQLPARWLGVEQHHGNHRKKNEVIFS